MTAISAAGIDEPEPNPGFRGWWAVGVLTLLYTLSLLDRQILSLLIKPIRADLQISDFQISILQGFAFALFYSLFGLPFGVAADRFSRRWVIFLGVTVWAIAASACGLARNYPEILAARFFVGIGEAALMPAAFSLIADCFPKRRLAVALSIFATGGTLGTGVALLGGGLLIDHLPKMGAVLPLVGHLASWQLVLVLTGVPCLLVSWLALTLPDPRRASAGQAPPPRLRDLIPVLRSNSRFYAGHFLGFSLISGSGYAFIVWTPTYLIRHFGWSASATGLALALAISIAGSIGPVLVGALVDRLFRAGRKDAHLVVYIFTGLIQILILVAAMSASSAWVFLVFATLNFCLCSFTGSAAAALQIVTPREFRGQISAAFMACMALVGAGCGPTAVATFTDFVYHDDQMVGWAIASTFAVFIPLAGLLLWMAAKPMREALANQPDDGDAHRLQSALPGDLPSPEPIP